MRQLIFISFFFLPSFVYGASAGSCENTETQKRRRHVASPREQNSVVRPAQADQRSLYFTQLAQQQLLEQQQYEQLRANELYQQYLLKKKQEEQHQLYLAQQYQYQRDSQKNSQNTTPAKRKNLAAPMHFDWGNYSLSSKPKPKPKTKSSFIKMTVPVTAIPAYRSNRITQKWMDKFKLLKEFVSDNGDAQTSRRTKKEYPGLKKWVRQQRRAFKIKKGLLVEGKKKGLYISDAKINLLNSVNFIC